MASTGVTTRIPPVPTRKGRGGLLDTLRDMGLVYEYTEDVPDDATDRQRAGEDALPGGFYAATVESTRWAARSESWPEGCGDVNDWVDCSANYTEKPTSTQPDKDYQDAWELVADDACGLFSVPYEQRVERAFETMRRKQSNAVAYELWHGEIAADEGWANLSLAGSSTALTGPGLSSPLSYALGALQEALAECLGDGQSGIIHATRTTLTGWWKDGALNWDADRGLILDAFDNVVIASGGYDGADPDGFINETRPWAYATGPVVVRLGPISVLPSEGMMGASLERENNDLTVYAERSVAYQFDGCCVYGIEVNLCDTACTDTGS